MTRARRPILLDEWWGIYGMDGGFRRQRAVAFGGGLDEGTYRSFQWQVVRDGYRLSYLPLPVDCLKWLREGEVRVKACKTMRKATQGLIAIREVDKIQLVHGTLHRPRSSHGTCPYLRN